MTSTTPRKRGRPVGTDAPDTILTAAVQVCRQHGYPAMTSALVATAAGVSPQLVSHYYTPGELRAAVCRVAIEQRILSIIAEAVAVRSPHVAGCPVELRSEALAALTAAPAA